MKITTYLCLHCKKKWAGIYGTREPPECPYCGTKIYKIKKSLLPQLEEKYNKITKQYNDERSDE